MSPSADEFPLAQKENGEYVRPRSYGGEVGTSRRFFKRRRLWLLVLAGIIISAAAIIIPVVLVTTRDKSSGGDSSDRGDSNGSGDSTDGGETDPPPNPPQVAITGGDGSEVTMEDGTIFTYVNKFGGYWVSDPENPWNNDARPNSWTPPLNTSWDYSRDRIYG